MKNISRKTGGTRNDLIIKSLDFALDNVVIEGEDGTWECPECHHKGNKGKFCEECGHKREE